MNTHYISRTIIVMILLISGVVSGQTKKGTIEGTVKDPGGKPVEAAYIILQNTSYSTLTNENGYFIMKNIPEGNYRIASKSFNTLSEYYDIEVKESGVSKINISFTQPLINLKEVTITSAGIKDEIKDIPGTVNLIDSRAIKESGAQNIGQIINRVPGVNYLDEDGRGLKPNIGLRGLDPLRNRNLLVLIDGKFPIGMTLYGDPAAYYMMPIEQVDRIEVIKGASPVLYGGYSVGGVINMITKKGKLKPETKFDMAYGSYNAGTFQASTSGESGKLNYYISGLRRQGDGYRDRSKFAVNDYTVKLSNKIDSTSELSLYLDAYTENSQTPGGLTQKQYDENPRQSQHSSDQFYAQRFSSSLSYRKTLNTNHHFSTSVYGNYFQRDWWIAYKNPKNNGYLRDIHAIGNVTDYNYTGKVLGFENSFITGIRLHTDRLDDINIAGATKESRTGNTTGNKINTSLIYEGFIYNELSLTRKLTIAPGVRYTKVDYKRSDYIAQRNDKVSSDAWVYSGGVIYKATDNLRFYTTVSKGYQPPSLNSSLAPGTVEAGVDLKPETSMNYEAGFRTSFSWLAVNASVYRMDFKNKVITESGINKNAGSSYHRGIEAEVEVGPWKGASIWTNGALQKATFSSGADAGKILPNAPQHLLSSGIRYRLPFEKHHLVLNVFNNYVGKQYSDSKNTEAASADGKKGAIPAYNVTNATINYKYNRWGIYVNINNIWDRKYYTLRWDSWNGIIPSPGRNYMAGITYTL